MQNPEASDPAELPKSQLQHDALRLFEDPAMKAILAYVRGQIRRESETSRPDERELREHCYYMLNAVVRIDSALRVFAAGGKLSLVRSERSNVDSGSAA